jgi:hypothetical protein
MSLEIPYSQQHLQHTAHATIMEIHIIFPPDANNKNDPISLKKLLEGDGQYSTLKCLLSFNLMWTIKCSGLKTANARRSSKYSTAGYTHSGKQA